MINDKEEDKGRNKGEENDSIAGFWDAEINRKGSHSYEGRK